MKTTDTDRGLALRRNPWYKPEGVSYRQVHHRVEYIFGKPDLCENPECTNTNPKRFHWSNVSGKYYQDIDAWDWQRLCVKCHNAYDKKLRSGLTDGQPLWLNKFKQLLDKKERVAI